MRNVFLYLFVFCLSLQGYFVKAQSCSVSVATTVPTCYGGSNGTATVNITGTTAPNNCGTPAASPYSCSSGTIVNSNASSITVGSGQQVTLTYNGFTQGITMNGGTLVICGSATPSSLNFNSGTIIINGSATFPSGLNLNTTSCTLYNYGTLSISNGTSFYGQFTNNGTITVSSGDFNDDEANGTFTNTGTITVSNGSFNNNHVLINSGTINVSGTLNNNGGANFTNNCTISCGNFINSSTFVNNGNITVSSGSNFLNGGSVYTAEGGSQLNTGSLTINGTVNSGGQGCALVKVTGNTTINSGVAISGSVSICSGSLTNNSGTSFSQLNCTCNVSSPVATYSWSNGSTAATVNNLAAGNYSVTVTIRGCSTVTKNFTVGQGPQVTTTITPTNISCKGGSNGAIALSNPAGGTSPYTYSWSNGATTQNLSGLVAGKYSVTITDSKGCKDTTSATLSQPAAALSASVVSTVSCTGQNTGTVTLTVSGGTSPYTYSWSNSATTQNLSNVAAGTYTVTVTDAKGCTTTASATVSQNPAITATASATNENCNAGTTGAVSLTVSGGTSPYTYKWSNNATTQNLSSVAAATYTVTITDSKACTATATAMVTQPTAITATTTATNENCNGGNTGAVTLAVSGGTSPYTYSWSNSATTQNLTGLTSGKYKVTITDSKGCTDTTSATVTQPTAITATASATNENCNGGTTGAVSLTVSGGTSPYTYKWSNNATTQNLTGVAAATYTVTITDSKACTATATATVTQPTAITATTIATNENCNAGTTGAVSLTVSGGTSPYTYSWSNSATTQNLTGLTSGKYKVTITDSKGCTDTTSATVTQPTAITATATATNESCSGGATGSVALTVSGGTSPYTYRWSNNATTQNLTGVAAATYTVTVTDSKGCTGTASAMVTQPTAITATATATNESCSGGATGSVALTVSGGTSPYIYNWSNSAITQNLSGVAAGTYTVTVTDSKGCTGTASATVTQPTAITASATATSENCNGGSNASVSLTVSGGTSPYTYSWSNGATTQNLSGIAAGTYTVTVTDAKGCTKTASATVSAPSSSLTASASATGLSCSGVNNGTVTLTVSGGTSPYSYSWSNGAVTQNLTGLAAGNYTVTVTDSKGCTATASATVAGSSVQISGTVTVKGGDTASIAVSGGTAPYSYLWSSVNGTLTTQVYATPGNYTVTATDSRNCSVTLPVVISDPSLSGGNGNNGNGNNGNGNSGNSSGGNCQSISVSYASNGTYSISCACPGNCQIVGTNGSLLPPGYSLPVPGVDSSVVLKLPGGELVPVTVRGKDSFPSNNNGGGGSGGGTTNNGSGNNLNNPLKVTYTVSPSSHDNSNGGGNGQITLTITGGTGGGGGSYVVTNSQGDPTSTNGNTTIISNIPGGTDTLVIYITDTLTGFTKTLKIPVGNTPTINTNLSQQVNTDSGTVTYTDKPTSTVPSNTTITNYWTTPGGTNLNPNDSGSVLSLSQNTVDTIPIVVDVVTVHYPFVPPGGSGPTGPNPTAPTTHTDIIPTGPPCAGTGFVPSITTIMPSAYGSLNGSISISNLPSGAKAYWGGAPALLQGATASGLGAGTYTLILVESQNGSFCTLYTGTVTLTQPAQTPVVVNTPPVNLPVCTGTISLSPVQPSCTGKKDGFMSATFTGTEQGVRYYWSGPGITGSHTNTYISNLGAGTYTVSVVSSNPACNTFVSYGLLDPLPLEAYYTIQGQRVTIVAKNGTPGYKVTWLSDNTVAVTRSDLQAGNTYTVLVQDSRGCSVNYTFKYAPCQGDPVGAYVLVDGSNNATPVVTSGSGTYSYNWSTQTSGVSIANPSLGKQTGLANGNYTLTITDSKGCSVKASVSLPSCGMSLSAVQQKPATCGAQCDGAGLATVSPQVSGTLLFWDSGSAGAQLLNACAGNHTVIAISPSYCAISQPLTISASAAVCPGKDPKGSSTCQNNTLAVSVQSQLVKKCFSDLSFVTIAVSGGKGGYTYQWTAPGLNNTTETYISTSADLLNPVPGNYSLLVTDGNTCTASLNLTVSGPASALKANASVIPAACTGGNSTVTLNITGGLAPYSINWGDQTNTTLTRTDLIPGSYSVVITDALQCQVKANFVLTAPVFTGQIYASQRNLCVGETTTLTAGKVAGYSYRWSGPGILSYADSIARSFTTATQGTYSLTYRASACPTQVVSLAIGQGSGCSTNARGLICTPIVIQAPADSSVQDCIDQQKIAATSSANAQYIQYLADEKRNFKANYLNQIQASLQENLSMSYTDQEHQYTLYYYDQAGNLVRTVPPAGVVQLSDQQETSAESDLANNTSSVFTNHTLATTYKYNSLNQLIWQDVPDHNKMNLWQTSSSGPTLGAGQQVATAAYTASGKGIILANTTSQAAFYTTSDGGKTWQGVDNIGTGDIADIQNIDGNNVYAVAKGGLFLTSSNAGKDWLVQASPTSANLFRLYFSTTAAGTVMGSDGTMWTTANAGVNWSAAIPFAGGTQSVNDAWFDGTTGVWLATTDQNNVGHVWYYSNSAAGWAEQKNFRTGIITSIAANASGITLAGPAGALFGVNGNSLKVTKTNLGVSLAQLDITNGYSAVGSDHKLYTSTDGANWSVPSGASGSATVQQLTDIASGTLVSTSDGYVSLVSNGNANFVTSGVSTISKVRYTAVPVMEQSSGSILLTGNNGLQYVGLNGQNFSGALTPTILTLNSSPGSISDVYVSLQGSTVTYLLLTASGSMYSATEQQAVYPATNPTNTLAVNSTAILTGVKALYPVNGTLYVLMNSNAINVYSNGSFTALAASPASGNVVSIGGSGSTILVSYDSNTLYSYSGGGWSNLTYGLIPSAMTAIQAKSGAGYAGGANAEIYKISTAAGTTYLDYLPESLVTSGTYSDLGIDNSSNLHVALGSSIYSYTGANLVSEASGLSGNVTRLNETVSSPLAVTNNGSIYSNAGSWTLAYSAATPLYAISAGVAGGTGGSLYYLNGSSWTASDKTEVQPLNAVAYADATHLTAVGKEGTVVTSADGGQSWAPVYSTTGANLTGITAAGNVEIAGGAGGTIIYSSNYGASWNASASGTTTNISAVKTANGSLVLALAGNQVLKSVNGGASFTADKTLTGTAYGLWLDSKGFGYIVGANGLAYSLAVSGNSITYTAIATDANLKDNQGSGISPGATLRTVQFTDEETGYITGDNGLVLKTEDAGQHWNTEGSGGGTAAPVLALYNGEFGSVVNADGSVSSLNDQAQEYSSRMWYDQIGRLTLSQNTKQYNIANYNIPTVPGSGTVRAYSYTLYDDIGRITEVGELLTTALPPLGKDSSQVIYASVQSSFVTSGVKRQITKTYYDTAAFVNILTGFSQNNLRPRVSSTTYQEADGANYDRATHYSYDIEGNVQTLVHEIHVNGNYIAKRVDYDYDLVSGNVNYVYYQQGQDDQFIHKYVYDTDNRITAVYTSRDNLSWQQDATYQYYGHGPLARSIVGNKVDSMDFAYTLQGWIKGERGNTFSYGLGYYSGDYASIGSTNTNIQATPVNTNLFNGNIATMTSVNSYNTAPLTQQFEYDLLNRIKKSSILSTPNAMAFATGYTYDLNGNIKTLNRYDNNGAVMDKLFYHYQNTANGYKRNTNRLTWVNDSVQTDIKGDIEDQSRDNYGYDDIGDLQSDVQEEIANIDWNVYGKIRTITRIPGSQKPDLEFMYDPGGNRVAKIVKNKTGDTTVTYYVRDASGNVMSVYEQVANGASIDLLESHIYGRKRIGIAMPDEPSMLDTDPATGYQYYRCLAGLRSYELTDHLGNVRAVISDARTTAGAIALLSATDYYPFGLPMRTYTDGTYRYGFNGQELDQEVGNGIYTAEFWEYDARLGRRWNLDPMNWKCVEQSPYATFNNNPIFFSDPQGLEGEPKKQKVIKTANGGYMNIPADAKVEKFTTANAALQNIKKNVNVVAGSVKAFTVGKERYVAIFNTKTGEFMGYAKGTNLAVKFKPEAIIYNDDVTEEFKNKIMELSYTLKVDPNEFMAILRFENGGNWSPDRRAIRKDDSKTGEIIGAKNAFGIVSFTPAFISQVNKLTGKNYTNADVAKMTAVEQLDIVGTYLNWAIGWKGNITTFSDFYMAIHNTNYVGTAETTPIHIKGGKGNYGGNDGLDTDNNDTITKSEAAKTAYFWYKK